MSGMASFPIMLNMAGRLAVVIGGGSVGLRKAATLLEAGAMVTLIAPDISPEQEAQLQQTAASATAEGLPSPSLTVIRQSYRGEQLARAFLVFACTDDRALNAQIAADARKAGAIVNAADQVEDCDFFMPAVVRDGPVVIAVGTGGSAPGLAGFLRDRLADACPPQAGRFASALADLRTELRSKIADSSSRMAILKRLSGEKGYRRFVAKGRQGLRKLLDEIINKNDE